MTMDHEARALVAQFVVALAPLMPSPLPLDKQREEDALPDTAIPRHGRSIALGSIRRAGAVVADAALAATAD